MIARFRRPQQGSGRAAFLDLGVGEIGLRVRVVRPAPAAFSEPFDHRSVSNHQIATSFHAPISKCSGAGGPKLARQSCGLHIGPATGNAARLQILRDGALRE